MVAGEFVLQARKQRLNRIYLPTYFQARVDSWVAQSKMSYDGCKTKADTVKDFQMDVIFKMISSSITKVDKVYIPLRNGKVHWLLIVVDHLHKKVHILDPLSRGGENDFRVTSVRDLVCII
uniref:Ubiquitin-like protease family profile domain-containing protein n=2 Tax=Opuntia streptacantha TaxID=393608 RepID=A0A7C9DJW1_OPUST